LFTKTLVQRSLRVFGAVYAHVVVAFILVFFHTATMHVRDL